MSYSPWRRTKHVRGKFPERCRCCSMISMKISSIDVVGECNEWKNVDQSQGFDRTMSRQERHTRAKLCGAALVMYVEICVPSENSGYEVGRERMKMSWKTSAGSRLIGEIGSIASSANEISMLSTL